MNGEPLLRINSLSSDNQPNAVTSEDSEQAEQFLYRSSGQIGSGHHRHLINAAQMSDEGPQPYIVVPSRPCNHLDHEIAVTLDYPPHAVARSAGVPVRLEWRGR